MAVFHFNLKQILLICLFTLAKLCSAQTVESLVARGLEYDSMRQYSQAILTFTDAIKLDPTASEIYYNRGNSYMNSKKYNLALVDFNKAILIDSSNTDAYFNRHFANRFTLNFQFALSDITEYIKRNPTDLEAKSARADLAVEMKEYKIAIEDLNTLMQFEDAKLPYQLRIAEIYILNKQYTFAEDLYSKILQANEDANDIYLNRAYVRNYLGNYQGSVNDINLFSLRQPGFPEALKLKADNYFYLKRFEDAATLYKNLLLKDSINASLLADYGHCLLQLNKYAEAEGILTRSILAKAENPAYAYLGRGVARLNLGKGDLACSDWMKSKMLGEKRAADYLEKNCSTKEISTNPR